VQTIISPEAVLWGYLDSSYLMNIVEICYYYIRENTVNTVNTANSRKEFSVNIYTFRRVS